MEGAVDPLRDIDLIETELLLADLESIGRRAEGVTKRARGGDKEAKELQPLIERVREHVRKGIHWVQRRPFPHAVDLEAAGGLRVVGPPNLDLLGLLASEWQYLEVHVHVAIAHGNRPLDA